MQEEEQNGTILDVVVNINKRTSAGASTGALGVGELGAMTLGKE